MKIVLFLLLEILLCATLNHSLPLNKLGGILEVTNKKFITFHNDLINIKELKYLMKGVNVWSEKFIILCNFSIFNSSLAHNLRPRIKKNNDDINELDFLIISEEKVDENILLESASRRPKSAMILVQHDRMEYLNNKLLEVNLHLSLFALAIEYDNTKVIV